MWVLTLWVWLELPLTNSLVKRPLEKMKTALVIASPAIPTFLRKSDYGKLRGHVKYLSER